MTISVIIPCYNHQEYLASTIESVLLQTKKPHEIIVVNDGSTDNSLAVARGFQGVKVIDQVNKGLASARNTGIMNATGDYILPLDSDDMLKENAIEKITEAIEKTNADIIAPSLKCFGISNQDVVLKENLNIEDFKRANHIGYFSAIRRSKLLEVGGYSPRMTWGYEDYHLWFDLLKRGATLHVMKDVLVLYRTRVNSMITESEKHHAELMQQIVKDHPNL